MTWRVRPAVRPNEFITGVHSIVSDRVARDKLLPTRAIYTLLAFNGNAFAVRFSRSAIFFVSKVAL